MLWALLSILAALVWSVVNIVDKYVLSKFFKNPVTAIIIFSIFGLASSFLIYLFHGFGALTSRVIILSFVAGIFYALMAIFYFKAVKIEEVSRVIALSYLSPLFVSIIAALFLGEVFTLTKYLGIILLVIGAVLISVKRFKISFGKAFWFMIIATISISIYAIILKYLLNYTDFWTVFALTRIGTFLSLLPIVFTNFPDLVSVARKFGNKPILLLFINESLNLIALFLVTVAASIGFITLVNALSSIQPFFVLLFATILSVFYPRILKEEFSKQTVLLKLVAIAIMFLGAWLVM